MSRNPIASDLDIQSDGFVRLIKTLPRVMLATDQSRHRGDSPSSTTIRRAIPSRDDDVLADSELSAKIARIIEHDDHCERRQPQHHHGPPSVSSTQCSNKLCQNATWTLSFHLAYRVAPEKVEETHHRLEAVELPSMATRRRNPWGRWHWTPSSPFCK